MKLALILALLCLASCAAVPTPGPALAPSEPYVDRFSMYLGQRSLNEDDWSPVEDQMTLGLEYSREPEGSVVGFEIGLFASGDDANSGSIEGQTLEASAGVRKTFGAQKVRPYLGAGLAYINAEVEAGARAEDSSFAGYAHGGLAYQISEQIALGLDLRFLFGTDMEIAGVEPDADYTQLAIVLAVGF